MGVNPEVRYGFAPAAPFAATGGRVLVGVPTLGGGAFRRFAFVVEPQGPAAAHSRSIPAPFLGRRQDALPPSNEVSREFGLEFFPWPRRLSDLRIRKKSIEIHRRANTATPPRVNATLMKHFSLSQRFSEYASEPASLLPTFR